MCAHTCDVPEILKNENYAQFPFQRWHRRQKRTFQAHCGSTRFLLKNPGSEQKIEILEHIAEIRDFLLYFFKLSYRIEFLSYKKSGHGVGKL